MADYEGIGVDERETMFARADWLRERVVLGLIAILVGLAVYMALGLAWSFKTAVETSQRLWHSYSRPY